MLVQITPPHARLLGNPKTAPNHFHQGNYFWRGVGGRGRWREEEGTKKLEMLKVPPSPHPTPYFPERELSQALSRQAKSKVALGRVANVYLWNELLLFDTFTFPVKILKMVL